MEGRAEMDRNNAASWNLFVQRTITHPRCFFGTPDWLETPQDQVHHEDLTGAEITPLADESQRSQHSQSRGPSTTPSTEGDVTNHPKITPPNIPETGAPLPAGMAQMGSVQLLRPVVTTWLY